MPTFTWIPDQAPSKDVEMRVNGVEFGDSYSQNTPDGLNSVRRNWEIEFTLRTKAEIEAIDAFLEALKGASTFDWTGPDGVARKYLCKGYSVRYYHDGNAELRASLREEFY